MSVLHDDDTPPRREPIPFTHPTITQEELDAITQKLPDLSSTERLMALTPKSYVGGMFHKINMLTWRDIYMLHKVLQKYKELVNNHNKGEPL